MIAGWLLVERYVVDRASSIGVRTSEVRERYRGFDGIAWPGATRTEVGLVEGLASDDALPRLRRFQTPIGRPDLDLIYCTDGAVLTDQALRFLGYDVGYYESEYLYYSVVLNEVIFGTREKLVAFGPVLNESLLLDATTGVERLLTTREGEPKNEGLESGPERLRGFSIFELAG